MVEADNIGVFLGNHGSGTITGAIINNDNFSRRMRLLLY
jgi:hypothetical protein